MLDFGYLVSYNDVHDVILAVIDLTIVVRTDLFLAVGLL